MDAPVIGLGTYSTSPKAAAMASRHAPDADMTATGMDPTSAIVNCARRNAAPSMIGIIMSSRIAIGRNPAVSRSKASRPFDAVATSRPSSRISSLSACRRSRAAHFQQRPLPFVDERAKRVVEKPFDKVTLMAAISGRLKVSHETV